MTLPSPSETIASLHLEQWGRLLAALIGDVHDIELAEDSLQDSFAKALAHWQDHGIPKAPASWLFRTARNCAVDRIRRQETYGRKLSALEAQARALEIRNPEDDEEVIEDRRLMLMFTCCHPALTEATQVALTLQTLGGLTTKEIALAFLTSESTMAQRLVRAKKKIKAAHIPFAIPSPDLLPERITAILSIIYLIFNEGYAARTGQAPVRANLVNEALQLGRVLARLLPRDTEVAGLLALMMLHDARRAARYHGNRPVPLDSQDRSLWDQGKITLGVKILEGAMHLGRIGPYQIQAAISAVHAEAQTAVETDWKQIALLYDRLLAKTGSAVVQLNRAVALSFADGPERGLSEILRLAGQSDLQSYQPFHAAHADILRRAGKVNEAKEAYRQALTLTENQADRLFLNDRLVELGPNSSSPPPDDATS
ncbi:MAG: RNA polymerase sigma-70 factor (ECF subfamily) [Planctomycetota bacterium]|jgi:RNA polymerase sigma-70 factor (ECF subfamily)